MRQLSLRDAPTTAAQSVLASLGATFGSYLLLLSGFSQKQPAAAYVMSALAVVGMTLGPSLGDLLNGDSGRFISQGLWRAGILSVTASLVAGLAFGLRGSGNGNLGFALALAVFGIGGTTYLVHVVMDIVRSQDAPERWLEREAEQRRAAAPGVAVSLRF